MNDLAQRIDNIRAVLMVPDLVDHALLLALVRDVMTDRGRFGYHAYALASLSTSLERMRSEALALCNAASDHLESAAPRFECPKCLGTLEVQVSENLRLRQLYCPACHHTLEMRAPTVVSVKT